MLRSTRVLSLSTPTPHPFLLSEHLPVLNEQHTVPASPIITPLTLTPLRHSIVEDGWGISSQMVYLALASCL